MTGSNGGIKLNKKSKIYDIHTNRNIDIFTVRFSSNSSHSTHAARQKQRPTTRKQRFNRQEFEAAEGTFNKSKV